MKKTTEKTNVMRILDQKKAVYESHCYVDSGVVSGEEVAKVLGQDPQRVFKTLVTVGASKTHYVFLIPVEKELNLKKAAAAVKEKSIVMLPAKELLPLTGYVHGGCSPVGMKKPFKTTVDQSAADFDRILFSGGKIGYQVETALSELEKAVEITLAPLTD